MNNLFLAIIIIIPLKFLIEGLIIYYQKKKHFLTRVFKHALGINTLFILISYVAIAVLTYFLYYQQNIKILPEYSSSSPAWLIGAIIFAAGIFFWLNYAYISGKKHAWGLRPFVEKVHQKKWLYKWVRNPMYIGFILVFIGLALMKNSLYFTIIAVELIIVFIPYTHIEHICLKK